jgi:hypothetical protein
LFSLPCEQTAPRRLAKHPDAQRSHPTGNALPLSTSRDLKIATPLPSAQSPSVKNGKLFRSRAAERRKTEIFCGSERPNAEKRKSFAVLSARNSKNDKFLSSGASETRKTTKPLRFWAPETRKTTNFCRSEPIFG